MPVRGLGCKAVPCTPGAAVRHPTRTKRHTFLIPFKLRVELHHQNLNTYISTTGYFRLSPGILHV
jgi:hypothetical protein